jgi:hypothetical protein
MSLELGASTHCRHLRGLWTHGVSCYFQSQHPGFSRLLECYTFSSLVKRSCLKISSLHIHHPSPGSRYSHECRYLVLASIPVTSEYKGQYWGPNICTNPGSLNDVEKSTRHCQM